MCSKKKLRVGKFVVTKYIVPVIMEEFPLLGAAEGQICLPSSLTKIGFFAKKLRKHKAEIKHMP